jgi:hypothetical protein
MDILRFGVFIGEILSAILVPSASESVKQASHGEPTDPMEPAAFDLATLDAVVGHSRTSILQNPAYVVRDLSPKDCHKR